MERDPGGGASALRTLGESERAAEQFDIVLDRLHRASAPDAGGRQSRVPALADVYRMRAQARVAFDLEGAVADFEEALAHDMEPLAVYHGLGQALERLAGQSRRVWGHRAPVSAPVADRLLREARAAAAPPARRSSPPWRPSPGTLRHARRWHSFSAGKATWMEPSAS